MRKFNPFCIDDTLMTYTYPIVKVLACIVIIIFIANRNYFFHIKDTIWDFIISVICGGIGIASIHCISISVGEMIIVSDNRSNANGKPSKKGKEPMLYPIDKIVSLVKDNDIIEIQINHNGKAIEVGASSDSEAGNSKLFNKLYYIKKKEFENLDDFRKVLSLYSDNGHISVISIDGVSPKRYLKQ